MFPLERDLSCLREVKVFGILDRDGRDKNLISGFLRRFSHVQSLVADGCGISGEELEIALLARLHELTFKDCILTTHKPEDFFTSLFEQEEFNLKRITVLGKTWADDGTKLSGMSDEEVGSPTHWTTLINSKLRRNVFARLS